MEKQKNSAILNLKFVPFDQKILNKKEDMYCFFFWVSINIIIWAMSWQNLLLPYANNKGADQTVHAHPRSLISVFVVAAWIV